MERRHRRIGDQLSFKMKILFTHPHDVPNLYDFFFFYFCLTQKTKKLFFPPKEVNQCVKILKEGVGIDKC